VPSDDNETRSSGRGGRWLALIPASVAFVLLFLLMPRAVPPEDIPLPEIDARALAAVERDDVTRAQRARQTRLPDDVLAVGSAIRAFGKAQSAATEVAVGDAEGRVEAVSDARAHLDDALRQLVARSTDPSTTSLVREDLRTLRAVQLAGFLDEVRRFEATGKSTPELEELGGAFVPRMSAAGWIEGKNVLLTEREQKVTYKLVWTTILGASQVSDLALTLDEQRVLYTLYLTRPHAPEAQRQGYVAQRKAASSAVECARADAEERAAAELWRADKIRKLGEVDPTYPTGFALGVAYFRAGRYDQSVEAFRAWSDRHPDGPWALRSRHHLKAALLAYGP